MTELIYLAIASLCFAAGMVGAYMLTEWLHHRSYRR